MEKHSFRVYGLDPSGDKAHTSEQTQGLIIYQICATFIKNRHAEEMNEEQKLRNMRKTRVKVAMTAVQIRFRWSVSISR